jgi:DNA-binding Lrp family transcriptional regulator
MDDLDRTILQLLQADGRISNADLARQVNLSPPAVHARVRRLEEAGLIRGYVALLGWEALGYDMLCFIHISLKQHTPQTVADFRAAMQDLPEVLECHHVTGESDYLLKVVIRNRQDLERFVVDRLTPVPGIGRIHTSLALAEVKNTTALPV